MALNEDIDLFLADFGVAATFGIETARVIFDMPDVMVFGDVISAEYTITYKTGVFAALTYHSSITVDGERYQVNKVMRMGDGKLTQATLSKV